MIVVAVVSILATVALHT